MICAWDAYISLLPLWMRAAVDKLGADCLQELHLRVRYSPQLVLQNEKLFLERTITEDDIQFVLNAASKYSPWTADTLRNGYITAVGGHRIGICGELITDHNKSTFLQNVNMLCLRVARDFVNISKDIQVANRSILIIGRPGCGKTTLLRDLIRRYSRQGNGNIGVVDERCELFPISQGKHCFDPGSNTDVVSGIEKASGMEMLLRCMNPDVIAVDEITSKSDCNAIMEAGGCGVRLFATAHAGNREEFLNRPVYKSLISAGLFDFLVIMRRDKSWSIERMSEPCFA